MGKIRKYKKQPRIIAEWLLKLSAYIPEIHPRNKDEAIAYFYFIKLLNDIFTVNAVRLNKTFDGITLTSTRIDNSYGGYSKYFQRYLNLFFYRTHYAYKKFKTNKKVARKYYFHSHIIKLLKIAHDGEFKAGEMQTVYYPESIDNYNFVNRYSIPYKDTSNAIQIGPHDEILLENKIEIGIRANYGKVTQDKTKKENQQIKAILDEISNQMATGHIILSSREEINKRTQQSMRQLRKIDTIEVIELKTTNKINHRLPIRDNNYEYAEDTLKINVEAVNKLIENVKDEKGNLKKIYYVSFLSNLIYAHEHHIPLLYRSKQIGLRLMNISEGLSPALQGMPKALRNAIYAGFYDYDISAAAPTILYQYYRQSFPDEKFRKKYFEEYIGNKKNHYRNILTNLIIDIEKLDEKEAKKLAKKIFTGAIFGSIVLAGVSEMELSEELRTAMINHPEIDGLIEDINQIFNKMNIKLKKIRKTIYKEIPSKKNPNKTSRVIDYHLVKIPHGLELKFERWDIKRILALVYQSIERNMMDIVVKKFGEKILLRIHDGFIASEELEIHELEADIFVQTEFKIRYECQIL